MNFYEKLFRDGYKVVYSIVLKLGSVIDTAKALSRWSNYWVTG